MVSVERALFAQIAFTGQWLRRDFATGTTDTIDEHQNRFGQTLFSSGSDAKAVDEAADALAQSSGFMP